MEHSPDLSFPPDLNSSVVPVESLASLSIDPDPLIVEVEVVYLLVLHGDDSLVGGLDYHPPVVEICWRFPVRDGVWYVQRTELWGIHYKY